LKLSQHFTLAEFTGSDTAARRGIDNRLPDELIASAHDTCDMLERIRALLGVPVIITSGYRCHALNEAIGSSRSSDHIKAMAADIKAPEFGSAYDVARALIPHVDELGIGQLIHEYGTWVHVSSRTQDKPVNRVITISHRGTEPGINEVTA
jgi:zinc D-Ala-D-Ala carboxypeptidase